MDYKCKNGHTLFTPSCKECEKELRNPKWTDKEWQPLGDAMSKAAAIAGSRRK